MNNPFGGESRDQPTHWIPHSTEQANESPMSSTGFRSTKPDNTQRMVLDKKKIDDFFDGETLPPTESMTSLLSSGGAFFKN